MNQEKVYGIWKPKYVAFKDVPPITVPDLHIPCKLVKPNGSVANELVMRFVLVPCAGKDLNTTEDVIKYFKKTITLLQQVIVNPKFSLEEKYKRAEHYREDFDVVVTMSGRPELAGQLLNHVNIHLNKRYTKITKSESEKVNSK